MKTIAEETKTVMFRMLLLAGILLQGGWNPPAVKRVK
jgi:hypothetical protein